MKKLLVICLVLTLALFFCACGDGEESKTPSDGHIHTIVENPARDATCTEDGATAGSHCSECGEAIKAPSVIKAKGHKEINSPETPATCAKEGKTAGKSCEVCGIPLGETKSIPKLPHDFAPATCSSAKKCKNCGATEGDTLAHNFAPATCSAPKKCKDCGATEGTTLAHNFAPATCSAPKKCKDCGATEGSPASHKSVKVADKASTCSGEGYTGREQCSVCGEITKEGTVTPAAKHTEVVIDAVLPVNGKGAKTSGIKCSACDEIIVEPVDPMRYVTREGYKYISTLENSEEMLALYDRLWHIMLTFHLDETQDLDGKILQAFADGEKNLTQWEANFVVNTLFIENRPLFYWSAGGMGSFRPDGTFSNVYMQVREEYANGEHRRNLNLEIYREIQSMKSDGKTDFEKAKDFHDIIVSNASYAYDENGVPVKTNWAHNVLGYVQKKQVVCEGYTDTYCMVMNYNGIPCLRVSGSLGSASHAWNLIRLDDGKWYWCDLTQDDPPTTDGSNASRYTFFCVNDTQKVHGSDTFFTYDSRTTNDMYKKLLYPMPERAETPYFYNVSAEQTVKEAKELGAVETLAGARSLTGTVTKIVTAYSSQYKNITVEIKADGTDFKLTCYRLAGNGAESLKVGDKITVTGNIQNYRGTQIQFSQGCTFTK